MLFQCGERLPARFFQRHGGIAHPGGTGFDDIAARFFLQRCRAFIHESSRSLGRFEFFPAAKCFFSHIHKPFVIGNKKIKTSRIASARVAIPEPGKRGAQQFEEGQHRGKFAGMCEANKIWAVDHRHAAEHAAGSYRVRYLPGNIG